MDDVERELVSGGVDRDATGRRLSRGNVLLASLALLAVAAIVVTLAGRSGLRVEAGPTPTPAAPTPAPAVRTQVVVDLVAGRVRMYALLGVCDSGPSGGPCEYRLMARDVGGGGWRRWPLPMPAVKDRGGLSARLLLTGTDLLTVIDDLRETEYVLGETEYVLGDDGNSVTVHGIGVGAPVDAVPTGLVAEYDGRLFVLDPPWGVRRALASQPPISPVRAVATGDDGTIWVAGQTAAGVVAAASIDRGRSWRALPVRGLRPDLGRLQLVPMSGRRGAYLLGERDELPDVKSEFSELWQIGDPARPGATWTRATPVIRPRSAGSAVGTSDGGLLVEEDEGGVWRLEPGGTMRRLPDPVVAGHAVDPLNLRRGPGRTVLAQPAADLGETVVLVSERDGEGWRALVIPPG